MTDQPLIDTHVHLWDPSRLRYDWHRDVPALNRAFLLDDFRNDSHGLNIEGFVFVECGCPWEQAHDEVAMVTELAASDSRLLGIVAKVALEKGDAVREDLTALAENRLVKGVRRLTQDEPDPEFCNGDEFVAGTRALADFGFSCDLCITHVQLAATTKLVQACPSVNFILDHLGKPNIRGGQREPWASRLRELAALPNVCCKLSGVVTEADHNDWTFNDIEFYLRHALDCFGPDRLLYGGDWPVVRLAAPYRRWVECVERVLTTVSTIDRDKICRENARDVYRLA